MDVCTEFTARRPNLEALASTLRQELGELFEGNPAIDTISARAKSIDQFCAKTKRLDEHGKPKYADPLRQIQDQVGARVVVKFQDQVPQAVASLLGAFNEVEDQVKTPETPEQFGYEAHHLVCLWPPDWRATYKPHIGFFEIQVCTLFQHAWAEANHDIGYKPSGELSLEQRKLKSWAAASAWSADRAFAELRVELGQVPHK